MTTAAILPPGRILIIDDEAELAAGLKMLLEYEGFEVMVQPSPLGLAFILRGFNPDVILLDLSIPTLGGDTVLRLDREKLFPTAASIILYSGRGREELAGLAEEYSVDGFFSKGDDVTELLVRIPKWIAARRGRDAFRTGAALPAAEPAGVDLQPVVVVRTDAASCRGTAMLQIGGYVVVRAGSDELACALVQACGASAIIVDLGVAQMNAFAANHLHRCNVPALFLSPFPPLVETPSGALTLPRHFSREMLLDVVDRLVCGTETRCRVLAG